MDANIQKYRALISTVECGSFTQAAMNLSYSQSGISRMIADLEREWGIVLLERGRSGVRPTSDGLKLLPYARKLCQAYADMQAQVDELNGLQSGLIRIGTISSIATHWLPPIIKVFQRDYPNVDYELLLGDYAEIEAWVIEGRVDCAFLRLPTVPDFETVLLERDELMAILPENHPLSQLERIPMCSLCDDPFILLEKSGRAEASDIFSENKLTPKVRFVTWDDYAVMSMVESGMGISILPRLILKRIPYRIAARSLERQSYRNLGFAVREARSVSTAVKKFMQYLNYRNQGEATANEA